MNCKKTARTLLVFLRLGLAIAVTCQVCPQIGYYNTGCTASVPGTCVACASCTTGQSRAGCTGTSSGTCKIGVSGFALITDVMDNSLRKIDLTTSDVTTITTIGTPISTVVSCDGSFAYYTTLHDTGLKNSQAIIRVSIGASANVVLAGKVGVTGYADGVGTNAIFNAPGQLKISKDCSYIIVSDCNNHRIRKVVISTQNVSTVAGTGVGGTTSYDALSSKLNYPYGIAFSPDGSYILFTEMYAIRKLTLTASGDGVDVIFVAGSATTAGTTDGYGQNARFYMPQEIDISSDGLFAIVADTYNGANQLGLIRKITLSNGLVSTLVNSGTINTPFGVSILEFNNYAIVSGAGDSKIYLVSTSTGAASVLAGNGVAETLDGKGTAAQFSAPAGTALFKCKINGYGYYNTYDVCQPCPTGTFGDKSGSCKPCTVCGTGTYTSKACTSTTNTVCLTPDCSACASGQYQSIACTASSDRVCADCVKTTAVGKYTASCGGTSSGVETQCTGRPAV